MRGGCVAQAARIRGCAVRLTRLIALLLRSHRALGQSSGESSPKETHSGSASAKRLGKRGGFSRRRRNPSRGEGRGAKVWVAEAGGGGPCCDDRADSDAKRLLQLKRTQNRGCGSAKFRVQSVHFETNGTENSEDTPSIWSTLAPCCLRSDSNGSWTRRNAPCSNVEKSLSCQDELWASKFGAREVGARRSRRARKHADAQSRGQGCPHCCPGGR